ncbi:hypothetical protein HPB52_018994 [Rhipicephalus sanguineus]|uniref:Uncharacterized protein n=1 Tax=Rhipicephalus sanguineus TaxID=34632 RepID=A0A9D4T483_RHISA|nr:hypothetical protein HPB52_018994 [Rhipicephalus sanguineus]
MSLLVSDRARSMTAADRRWARWGCGWGLWGPYGSELELPSCLITETAAEPGVSDEAVPSIFPFRKTKPPRKPPRQRTSSAIPASKKKCTELHPPADSPMDLASAPDENEAPQQEIVADQNVLQEPAPTIHSELTKAIAVLEAQLATAKDQASKQQAELAEQALSARAGNCEE